MLYTAFITEAFAFETDYASAPFGSNNRLYHAMLGLASEGLELTNADNDANKLAELFDHCWFAALGILALDKEYVEPAFNPFPSRGIKEILVLDEELGSEIKRRLFYGRSKLSNDELYDIFVTIWLRARAIGDAHSTGDFLRNGLAKLAARYGKTYSSEAAVNRALEVEENSERRFVDGDIPDVAAAKPKPKPLIKKP